MRRNKYRLYNVRLKTKVRYQNSPSKEKLKKVVKIVLVVAIAYFFLTGNRGLIHLVQMKVEKYKLQKEIDGFIEENKEVVREIEELRTDLKAVERIAREELGLVKKGEIIYKFVSPEYVK